LKNRPTLFTDVPIVFLVLDQHNLDGLDLASNVTGAWGESNFKSNLQLALLLHPGTRKVFVISGVGEWDNYWRARVQQEFQVFKNELEFSYLVGLSIEEQKKALSAAQPNSLVFFVSSTQDNAGNNYGNLEVLREICPASAAPVYGTTDAHLGLGIVGGRLTSFEAFGVEGATIGLRVLAGEKPEAIAPHGISSVPMFDSRELKRWNISEARLPAGSIVRFREPTFWERYWGRILIALTLIALQTLFIVSLLIERRRRQRAREALARLNAELEEHIAARTAALNAKTKELETFTYSVAHDLKAPLRGIVGYSRLLLEECSDQLNDEGRSFVKTIHGSTEEMNQLIEDLLDYSRLERRDLKNRTIELKPLISALVEEKKSEPTAANIDFVLSVNGGTVHADTNGLTQALRNYIDNAIKFTRRVSSPRIEIGSEDTPAACRVWVADNGVGFDMKYHDRIFEIFQRLNRAEEYPGTGVGLAIVRKSMERMGGRAWAESTPGKGATFYLEIPKGPTYN
jgi:signal transduction histidine kinase